MEYDDEFKEIPLGAIIQAIINSKSGKAENYKIEYNYYEFRSRVQIREALYVVSEISFFFNVNFNLFTISFFI